MQETITKEQDKISEERSADTYSKKSRIEILDFLRGIAIIYVMLYHFLYDLIYMGGMELPFFHAAWFEAIHMAFVGLLMIVSGMCSSFSRNLVKRGAAVFFAGSALTMITDLFMPQTLIVFGILSFFGVMMMLCGFLRPVFDKMSGRVSVIAGVIFILLYFVMSDFPDGVIHLAVTDIEISLPTEAKYLYPLGIKHSGFYSSDYFPIIPYGFIYLAGASLSRFVKERKMPKWFYGMKKIPVVNFAGKHSLAFYIIHQPVFIAAFELVNLISR